MSLPPGHSGFFSAPSDQLDPNLFDGTHLKHDVRQWLLLTLAEGLAKYLDLAGANEWLHAWLAGSGITYQWSADRGNGDLDVLFGVDMARFTHWNPDFSGLPESYVADHADEVLKQKLWPATAHQRFGQQEYEVTFYWNPGTGADITRIHPYSAYDLKGDAWVVCPPAVPHDPGVLYPAEWHEAARRDSEAAGQLYDRHHNLTNQLSSTALGSPQAQNITAEITRTRQAASALFEEIHGGRREAFGEQGHGYSDWHNYRWQAAKASGVVEGLGALTALARSDKEAQDKFLYGGPVDGPEKILTRDMLSYGRTPYLR